MLNSDNNDNNDNNHTFKPIIEKRLMDEEIQKEKEAIKKEEEAIRKKEKEIERRKKTLREGREALAKKMTLSRKRKAELEEEKQLLQLKKQKQQVEVIRFKVDEDLPLTTRYISGDGCVSYVARNDGTRIMFGDAYARARTRRSYGMRQISVNGGPLVECATDSLFVGAIRYRADNGAIPPLCKLPDTAAMEAYRAIFSQCWKDSKTALPHCCDACKEHVVFALERGKWKDVVLKCPNESCNKQYKIRKFDGTNVGCYDISDVQAEVSNGSSSSSIVTTTTSPVESKDNEDIVPGDIWELKTMRYDDDDGDVPPPRRVLIDHVDGKGWIYFKELNNVDVIQLSHARNFRWDYQKAKEQKVYSSVTNGSSSSSSTTWKERIERVKKQIEQNKPPATKYETALDTLKREEIINQKSDNPLCDERVIEFTNLDWENAPNNISLRALSTLLSLCSYQRDLLKANILKKIMSLDLKSMESDIVEEYLLPEIDTIALMADTTLPQTWETMISLKAKIKRLFPDIQDL